MEGEPPTLLFEVAQKISDDPNLWALAWHLWWLVFKSPTWTRPANQAWPALKQPLGEDGGMFYLILTMDLHRLLGEVHPRWGFPRELTRSTALQFSCVAQNHLRGTGKHGVYPQQFGWFRNYVREPYVRMGRLEYWYKGYVGGVVVFRNGATMESVALAEDGQLFDERGRAAAPGSAAGLSGCWKAKLIREDDTVTGHRVAANGRVELSESRLSLAEWSCVLEKGAPVLELHIPAGGGLSPELMADSFKQAEAFFKTVYPLAPPVAIATASWMFSPDLPEILPADSNLLKIQKHIGLYPIPASGHGALWFVFQREPLDLATAPRQTSLQRALLAWLEAGNPWRSGGMYYLL